MTNVERFAAMQFPAAQHLDARALRDQVPLILEAIVQDLRTAQTASQAHEKSGAARRVRKPDHRPEINLNSS